MLPILLADEHYIVVDKPARIDLRIPVSRRGPAILELALRSHCDFMEEDGGSRQGGSAAPVRLIPLVTPDADASGLALFARTEEARRRFAGLQEGGKVRYRHIAAVEGETGKRRVTIKPRETRRPDRARGRAVPQRKPLPAADIEVLRTVRGLHLARCTMRSASTADLRRYFKAVGLRVCGDVRRAALVLPGKIKRNRRFMAHLEAIEFVHPFTFRSVAFCSAVPHSFQSYLATRRTLEDHLHAALVRRLPLLLDENTDCLRLFTGRNEGVGGLMADKLGNVLVLETLPGQFQGDETLVRQLANWYGHRLGVAAVCWKVFPKVREEASDAGGGDQPLTQWIKGGPVEEITVTENGLRFILHPGAKLLPGLFLDHRENRRRIRALAAGRSVLNLFAYTGGFSVAAAAGGASATTSVDLSTASLECARRNFEVNKLLSNDHSFVHAEVLDYCRRAGRQGELFDMVICDPPSFSRAKKPKRTFQIIRNLVDLLEAVLPLLKPGGDLLVATNFRPVTAEWLTEQVGLAAARTDRQFRIVGKPRLPVDFAADADYQKSVFAKFE